MKEQFINRYEISKTLRFRLIPQGNTQNNFEEYVLAKDEQLAINYPKAKEIIDRCHKKYIEQRLENFKIAELNEYAYLYNKNDKKQDEVDKMDEIAKVMRKNISERLRLEDNSEDNSKKKENPDYKKLFGKELFTDNSMALSVAETEEEKAIIKSFAKCTVYFKGFNENRENMYTGEGKSTEIAYRIIDDNLPKFLDNARVGKKVLATLSAEDLAKLETDFQNIFGISTQSIFEIDFFNQTLNQKGIDRYNQIIGGYTLSDGEKIKGYNEYINQYNQKTKSKLPQLVPLYKQILSDRETVSFIPQAFSDDEDLLKTLNKFYGEKDSENSKNSENSEKNAETNKSISTAVDRFKELFENIENYDLEHIYITNGEAVTDLSNSVCGDWSKIKSAIISEYDSNNINKNGDPEKYENKRTEELKKIKSYSLKALQGYIDYESEEKKSLTEYIKNRSEELCSLVNEKYTEAKELITGKYKSEKKLSADDNAAELIKAFLDSLMDLLHFTKMFLGSGKEPEKDDAFYGDFTPLYTQLSSVVELYNKVRNYITKKPYDTDKIKLVFDRSDFLNGWAQPAEWNSKEAHLFEKEGKYYIFITAFKINTAYLEDRFYGKNNYERAYHIEYCKQKPDNKNTPRLFVRSKGDSFAPAVKKYNLPINDIIELYDKEYFKADYKKKDPVKYKESLTKLIDYFKLGFIRHDDYKDFDFNWKDSSEYENISEFYDDTTRSCYKLKMHEINWNGLMSIVNDGAGFLFQIYNKDFSDYAKGVPNLHTLYFKMIFDEENITNGCFQLLGGAEMFYRKASLKLSETTVHPKGEAIKNKNVLNRKKESVFDYDLIKNKRFTENQFYLHIPIKMNYSAQNAALLNHDVRRALKSSDSCHIIGIDRGERNLLYVCVIDEKGKIIEQMSLNEIIGDNGYKVDYHELLDRREKERDEARKGWKNIENIKELKEGYMSQVIHKICELIIKYDAVVAMEDLNGGFKNSRIKVEKQVYQKFEKMLAEKLNYLADKKADPMSDGGLLRAYQLTNKFDGTRKSNQDGIIFYIPAWCTSKIDPVTGFVDMLKPKYENVEKTKEFIGHISDIRFNSNEDYYEFDTDMNEFPKCRAFDKTQWTICTNGSRIENYKDKSSNSQWAQREVVLTDEFDKLFEKYGIDKNESLKEQILNINTKDFFERFMHLLSLTLQMRNSLINRTDVDYLISPVKGENGKFYNSNDYIGVENATLPCDADANGAYNIARKVLLFINKLKEQNNDDDLKNLSLKITNAEWLSFTQNSHE